MSRKSSSSGGGDLCGTRSSTPFRGSGTTVMGRGSSPSSWSRGPRATLLDLKRKIAASLARLDYERDPEAPGKRAELLAMDIAADALIMYARRHAQAVRTLAERTLDPEKKRELLRIVEIHEWVPAHPLRDFWEVLQAYWFYHLGVIMELNGWDAFNPGHLDQHLCPFYERDIRSDKLTRERAAELRLLQPRLNLQLSRVSADGPLLAACRVSRKGYGYPSIFNADAVVEELLQALRTGKRCCASFWSIEPPLRERRRWGRCLDAAGIRGLLPGGGGPVRALGRHPSHRHAFLHKPHLLRPGHRNHAGWPQGWHASLQGDRPRPRCGREGSHGGDLLGDQDGSRQNRGTLLNVRFSSKAWRERRDCGSSPPPFGLISCWVVTMSSSTWSRRRCCGKPKGGPRSTGGFWCGWLDTPTISAISRELQGEIISHNEHETF